MIDTKNLIFSAVNKMLDGQTPYNCDNLGIYRPSDKAINKLMDKTNLAYFHNKITQLKADNTKIHSLDLIVLAACAWRLNNYTHQDIFNRNIMIHEYFENIHGITDEDRELANKIKQLFSLNLFNQLNNSITVSEQKCLRVVSLDELTWADASFVSTLPLLYGRHNAYKKLTDLELSFAKNSEYLDHDDKNHNFKLTIYNVRGVRSKKVWIVSSLYNNKDIVKFFVNKNEVDLFHLYICEQYQQAQLFKVGLDITINVCGKISRKELNHNTNAKETILTEVIMDDS